MAATTSASDRIVLELVKMILIWAIRITFGNGIKCRESVDDGRADRQASYFVVDLAEVVLEDYVGAAYKWFPKHQWVVLKPMELCWA